MCYSSPATEGQAGPLRAHPCPSRPPSRGPSPSPVLQPDGTNKSLRLCDTWHLGCDCTLHADLGRFCRNSLVIARCTWEYYRTGNFEFRRRVLRSPSFDRLRAPWRVLVNGTSAALAHGGIPLSVTCRDEGSMRSWVPEIWSLGVNEWATNTARKQPHILRAHTVSSHSSDAVPRLRYGVLCSIQTPGTSCRPRTRCLDRYLLCRPSFGTLAACLDGAHASPGLVRRHWGLVFA